MPLTKSDMELRLDDLHEKLINYTDIEGAMEYFDDDCKFLPPHNGPVYGKAGLVKWFDDRRKDPFYVKFQIKHTVEEMLDFGDIVIVDGKTVISSGGKKDGEGTFLNVFKKSGDGYKIVRMTRQYYETPAA